MRTHHTLIILGVFATNLALTACARPPETVGVQSSATRTPAPAVASTATTMPRILVHKSPSCGCCGSWVEHLRKSGFSVDVRNVVVVAAAGNASGECAQQNPLSDPKRPGTPDWDTVHTVVSPAWYDDYVLTAGSVSTTGTPSPFSLAGPWVDVAAPGESVVSLSAQGDGLVDSRPDSRPLSGTSYAAPVVSGVVALVRSRQPQLSARQVMARIKDTARHPTDGWNAQVGRGVVDPLAAVSGGTPAPAPARIAAAQAPPASGPRRQHRQDPRGSR